MVVGKRDDWSDGANDETTDGQFDGTHRMQPTQVGMDILLIVLRDGQSKGLPVIMRLFKLTS